MNLHLSANIRKYRREMSLSQEQLAERLGVSFQTVSKWERTESYPDITLLPRIAGFFHVTVDALLGVNLLQEERRWRPSWPNAARPTATTASMTSRRFWRRDWPNTPTTSRCWPGRGTSSSASSRHGRLRSATLRSFLRGDELLTHVEDNIILKLACEFWISIRKIGDSFTPDERIALYQKSNAVYDAIYETDDLGFKLTRKLRNYQGMAEVSLTEGRTTDGLAYLRQAADCAVRHDALPMTVESEALLFGAHLYNRESEGNPNLRAAFLHDLETEDEFYAPVRDTAEFRDILAMLNA